LRSSLYGGHEKTAGGLHSLDAETEPVDKLGSVATDPPDQSRVRQRKKKALYADFELRDSEEHGRASSPSQGSVVN